MKSNKTFKSIKIAPAAPTVTGARILTSSSLASVFVAEETQKLIAEQVAAIMPALVNPNGLPGYARLFNESAGGKGTFKVWSAWRDGDAVITEWGAEHATKQTNRKEYGSDCTARIQLKDLIASKRRKGYRENK